LDADTGYAIRDNESLTPCFSKVEDARREKSNVKHVGADLY